jgi:hypothetical protein
MLRFRLSLESPSRETDAIRPNNVTEELKTPIKAELLDNSIE